MSYYYYDSRYGNTPGAVPKKVRAPKKKKAAKKAAKKKAAKKKATA